MSINEIRDFPVNGFRNFIITTGGVVEIQNLPTDILRIKVIGTGSTIVYIWDGQGRKTIQIDVTGFATNQILMFRPGYDPSGNEFIYHMTMNNQFANGNRISPFWNHEFSASVPIAKVNEWRTLLRGSTNSVGAAQDSSYLPFSERSVLDQFLTYYQTPSYTAAAGDVNYNAGELSITGFTLRGASFQMYSDDRQDQFQVFGGSSRPRQRTNNLFSDPLENLFGAAVTKQIFPNVQLKTSFVYLDQPPKSSLFPLTTFTNDFVADIGFQARPFSDEWAFEGEYGRSRHDNAFRLLAEYAPFWGRVMASHRRIGSMYVNPTNFFIQKNYNQTDFVTDFRPTRKIGFTLNYQLNQVGENPILLSEKTTSHRFQLTNLYRESEEKSYLSSLSATRNYAVNTPQSSERADFTYQRFFSQSRNQLFAQFFGQHIKNSFLTQYTEKYGGGTDIRYTMNFSPLTQLYLQNTLQMNRVVSTFASSLNPKYVETIAGWGPTINYTDRKKTLSAGFFENFIFQNSFDQFNHLIQPFLTAYYNFSQALSFGSRMNYNWDTTNDTTFISVTAELVYRFGSRVPDTLFSTFAPSSQIAGLVFVDENNDGQYQSSEKLVENFTSQLNEYEPIASKDGSFKYKTDAGINKIKIELPKGYDAYQFNMDNPTIVNLSPRETKQLHFGINQRIPLHGKVSVRQDPNDSIRPDGPGLEAARIEISGNGFKNIVETSSSGIFNAFVTKPGKYTAKLLVIDLPKGYKYTGLVSIEFIAEEGKISKIPAFVVDARRLIIGRTFIDKNGNASFDETDEPAPNIKVKIGNSLAMSEEDGSFSINNLRAGTYPVRVEPQTVSGHRVYLSNDRLIVPEAGTINFDIPYQK